LEPKGLALPGRPVLVAVLGQQLTAVQAERRLKGRRVVGLARRRDRRLELLDVHPHVVLGAEHDAVVHHLQVAPPLTGSAVESPTGGVERLMEVVRRGGLVSTGPQGLGQLLAVPTMPGREREQLHDVLGLAQPPRGRRNRVSGHPHAERAKQADPDCRLRVADAHP